MHTISATDFPLFCSNSAWKCLILPAEFIQAYLHTFLTSDFCSLSSAAAYQSIIMLMGKQQLFEHWQGQAKVGHFEWSEEAASQVLESWKREFTKVCKMNSDYFTSFIIPPSPFPCIHLPLKQRNNGCLDGKLDQILSKTKFVSLKSVYSYMYSQRSPLTPFITRLDGLIWS